MVSTLYPILVKDIVRINKGVDLLSDSSTPLDPLNAIVSLYRLFFDNPPPFFFWGGLSLEGECSIYWH